MFAAHVFRRSRLATTGICIVLMASGCANRIDRTASPNSPEPLLAFPTAEGHGKYTVGGRGGSVFEVTNLDDSGAGSLRAAIEAQGARTVVFRVSGTIDLQSKLVIPNPHITIAGQTAPGDGITIKRHPLIIRADEVIIRYLRVRLGGESGNDDDAISGEEANNVILDHLSASWSIDEVFSVYHMTNLTVQWCIVAEPLFNSNHVKGAHGFGGIWGSNYGSYHHNLIANSASRNPRFGSGVGFTDFRNNVIYNWGYNSAYGGEAKQPDNPRFTFSTINMVANYYKPGPATQPGNVAHRIIAPTTRDGPNGGYGQWFVSGNFVEGNALASSDNWNGGVHLSGGATALNDIRLAEPWPAIPIRQQTPHDAFVSVLDHAGASVPRRDAVDRRLVAEARGGVATFEGPTYKTRQRVADPSKITGIIDSPEDVGGWPALESTAPPQDSDHDGMPDAWERLRKLDLHDPSDRNRRSAEGYTMLEIYLNEIAP